MRLCKNCLNLLNKKQKSFCCRKCWSGFYGKLNKGKRYKRHLDNYKGNQTSFKKGEHNSLETEFKKGSNVSPETQFKSGQIPWNFNKSWSPEMRAKLRSLKIGLYEGENNPNWKGGTTSILMRLRRISAYLIWRKAIFERDNYTCQNLNCEYCHNKRGVKLHADHIKPFAFYPELRFDINNGRTLCESYHRKTPTYGSKCREFVELNSEVMSI